MLTVAILITISEGNTSDEGCLEECRRQIEAIEAEGKYAFSVFLNNEGQSGCQSVWEKASNEGFDFFLWMDYDLRLKDNALQVFFENSEFLRHKAIIAGTVAASDKSLMFGGRSRHGRLLEPDQTIPVPCHLYDMDLVLVPQYAFSKLETPVNIFRQSFFDYGYGDKAAKAGVARVIAPGVLAEADRKNAVPVWKDPSNSTVDRIRGLLKAANREVVRIFDSFFR